MVHYLRFDVGWIKINWVGEYLFQSCCDNNTSKLLMYNYC